MRVTLIQSKYKCTLSHIFVSMSGCFFLQWLVKAKHFKLPSNISIFEGDVPRVGDEGDVK